MDVSLFFYDGSAVMRSDIKVDPLSLPAKWSVRGVSVVNDLLFEARAPHGQVNSFSGMRGWSDRRDLTVRRLFGFVFGPQKGTMKEGCEVLRP